MVWYHISSLEAHLTVDRVNRACTALRADRGPRRRRTKLSLAGCSQRILAGALEHAAMLARRSLTGGLKPAIGDDGVS